MIDLRSDTVTQPTREMRAAMAAAEVGDDVFGEDPTVRRLEELAAEKTGKEAAPFVLSGCMANLLAIMAQAPAGSEILVAENSHIHTSESGGYARLAQVNKWALPVDRFGRFDASRAAGAVRLAHGRPGGNCHYPQTSIICFENSHNFCGGTVQTPAEMNTVIAAVRARAPEIRVHLDGARIFNAAITLGCAVKDVAAPADTVSFCLSKGLCAPVGSVLCGSRETISAAYGLRKMIGGGLRQGGVLAACGLISLNESMTERLTEDHAHCRRLAEGLAEIRGVRIDLETVQTNILFFDYDLAGRDAAWAVRALGEKGVRCLTVGSRVRMVTHHDISARDIDQTIRIAADALRP